MSDRALLLEIRNMVADQGARIARLEERMGVVGGARAVAQVNAQERTERRLFIERGARAIQRYRERDEAQC